MAPNRQKKIPLKSSVIRKLVKELIAYVGGSDLLEKPALFKVVEKDLVLYVTNAGVPLAFQMPDTPLLPTLKLLQTGSILLPTVTVDVGAIRFVANGADIMAPGIRGFARELDEDEVVVVIDERAAAPLAIGKMLRSSKEIEADPKGKAVKNLHHLKDKIWTYQSA